MSQEKIEEIKKILEATVKFAVQDGMTDFGFICTAQQIDALYEAEIKELKSNIDDLDASTTNLSLTNSQLQSEKEQLEQRVKQLEESNTHC